MNRWTQEQVRENDKHYEACLAEAQRFQDFVVDVCWQQLGLAIVQYASREYQYKVGESKTGIEIKQDSRYAETGRLFIETESRRPPNTRYIPSGIFRKDNSWLYIIGNYNTLFIFSKKFLQQLSEATQNGRPRYDIIEIDRGTAKGFCLPGDDAEKYCVKSLTLEVNAADIRW